MTDQITNPDVVKSIYDLESDYVEFVEKCSKGGIKLDLSKWIPDFHPAKPMVPGELFVVMARTKHGKSCLLQNIARFARPLNVLYFSLELPGTLMFERFTAMTAQMTQEEVEQKYKLRQPPILRDLNHVYTCELISI